VASIFKRARWIDSNGQKCKKGDPGARLAKSRFYTIQYRLPSGRIARAKGYSDKAATEQKAAKLEKAKARGEQGMVDDYAPHRGRALSEHVAEYIGDLRTLGRASMYVYTVEKRLAKLLAGCAWATLGDVTADSFSRWRATPIKQRMAEGEARKIGPRTLNQYLEALRGFCKWCVKRKRMQANPMADVERVAEGQDVRRKRRALGEDEIGRLLAVVPTGHQIVYRFILATGLRRDEVATLRWADIVGTVIRLRAEATKSRRADVLPLRADLAGELATLRGEAQDTDRVFPSVPTMEQHRRYLKAAGVAWKDGDGRRADVHALRHTYGTLLSKSGASPREAMELMRHTDLKLTMKVYTDARAFDLAGAVERLPIPLGRRESGTHQTIQAGAASTPIDTQALSLADAQVADSAADSAAKSPIDPDGAKAGVLGFEPRQADPESAVLPLHHTPMTLRRRHSLYARILCQDRPPRPVASRFSGGSLLIRCYFACSNSFFASSARGERGTRFSASWSRARAWSFF
jgi:integrase